MPRYLLTLEYDGTDFCGWQRQDNGPSVQAAVECAGRALCGEDAPVYAAGRTDAGVHALGMAAHIDLPKAYRPDNVMGALNAHLREVPVSVLSARAIAETTHARFSCCGRSYTYRVLAARAPSPLRERFVWRVHQALDVGAMAAASAALLGRHDFTTFRASQCQAESPVKTMDQVSVTAHNDEVHIDLAAPSFLHNQVRSIVGSLVQVGLGRWPETKIADILAAKDRTQCGIVAPASGLYFVKAHYPDDVLAAPDANEADDP